MAEESIILLSALERQMNYTNSVKNER
jgi:hypothetical protein